MNECICVPAHLRAGAYDAGCPVHDVHDTDPLAPGHPTVIERDAARDEGERFPGPEQRRLEDAIDDARRGAW